jgi:hypothetical protein
MWLALTVAAVVARADRSATTPVTWLALTVAAVVAVPRAATTPETSPTPTVRAGGVGRGHRRMTTTWKASPDPVAARAAAAG